MATDPFPLHHQSEALFAVDAARLFAHLDDHRGLAGHRTGPLLGFGDPCFALAGRTCRLRRARLNNGPQPGRSDGDKPSDRGLGRHVVRRRERVETVDRQFHGCNILADIPGRRAFSEQISHEVAQTKLRMSDMFASAQQGGQFTAMVLVRNHRECLKHCFEALARTAGLVADLDELLEVMGDLAFVPGKQDRLDIREIFVRRFCSCTSSPSGFWRGLRPERR